MTLTSTEAKFVEHIAREQIRYEDIFREQSEVFRTDQAKYLQATAQLQQTSFVAKPGQNWQPTQDKVDEYLAQCDDICSTVPRDFDDRIKILYAAHAALICIATVKITPYRECVKLAILKKHHELSLKIRPITDPIASDSEIPLSKPSGDPRRITAEDLRLFETPDNLYGKQFILSPDSNESSTYEVIGFARKRDKKITYDVLFDDCEDPIMVDAKEMVAILEDSLYLPA